MLNQTPHTQSPTYDFLAQASTETLSGHFLPISKLANNTNDMAGCNVQCASGTCQTLPK